MSLQIGAVAKQKRIELLKIEYIDPGRIHNK